MAGLAEVSIGLTMRNIGETVTKDHIFTLSGSTKAVKQTGILGTSGVASVDIDMGTLSNTGMAGLYIHVISSWSNSGAATSALSGVFLAASGATSLYWTRIGAGQAAYLLPYNTASGASALTYTLKLRAGEYKEYSFEYAAFGI